MSEKSLDSKAAAGFTCCRISSVSFIWKKTAEYTEDAVKAMAAKGFLKRLLSIQKKLLSCGKNSVKGQTLPMAEVTVVANATAQIIDICSPLAIDGMTGYAVYEDGDSCGTTVTAAKASDAYASPVRRSLSLFGGAADQYIVLAALEGILSRLS